jgi:DNA-binding CsgD family transcriptional regulator
VVNPETISWEGVDLTGREAQILRLIAEDLSDRQIAAKLGLKTRTIQNRVSEILNKLNSQSRVGAAIWLKNYERENGGIDTLIELAHNCLAGIYLNRVQGRPHHADGMSEFVLNFLKPQVERMNTSPNHPLIETFARILFEQLVVVQETLLPSDCAKHGRMVAEQLTKLGRKHKNEELYGLAQYIRGDSHYIEENPKEAVEPLNEALEYVKNPNYRQGILRVLAIVYAQLEHRANFQKIELEAYQLIQDGNITNTEHILELQEGLLRSQRILRLPSVAKALDDCLQTYSRIEHENVQPVFRRVQLARTQLELMAYTNDRVSLQQIGEEALSIAQRNSYARYEKQIGDLLRNILN